MMTVNCPACGQKLKFREENHGKRLKCPGCGDSVDTSSAKVAAPGSVMAMPGTRKVSASGVPLDRKKELKFQDKRMPIYVKTMLVGIVGGAIVGFVWGIFDAMMFSAVLEAQSNQLEAETGTGLSAGFIIGASLVIASIRAVIFAVAGAVSGFIIGFTGNTLMGTVVLVLLAPLMLFLYGFFGIVDIVLFAVLVIPAIDQMAD